MKELTVDETLELLIEECAEVIKAATKCLRFGYDKEFEGYGVNHHVLASEIGDMLGVVDALPLHSELLSDLVKTSRATKIVRARRAKTDFGRTDR